jgi:hypothetical protein
VVLDWLQVLLVLLCSVQVVVEEVVNQILLVAAEMVAVVLVVAAVEMVEMEPQTLVAVAVENMQTME